MKKLTVEGKRFKVGTAQLKGIIHAEQGIPMFYCEREGVIARLPFFVSADMYEEPFTAFYHPGSDVIFTELSRDDILLEDVRPDMIDVIGEDTNLGQLLEKAKLEILPHAMTLCLCSVLSVIVSVVSILLFRKFLVSLLLGALTVGIIGATRSHLGALNSTVLYDKRGRWVDVATGKTNLNGGWDIPRY